MPACRVRGFSRAQGLRAQRAVTSLQCVFTPPVPQAGCGPDLVVLLLVSNAKGPKQEITSVVVVLQSKMRFCIFLLLRGENIKNVLGDKDVF